MSSDPTPPRHSGRLVSSETTREDRRSLADRRNAPRADRPSRRVASRRRADSARTRLNAPASVIVYDEEGARLGQGTVNVRNLSLEGALITQFHLDAGLELDPLKRYRLALRVMAGPLAGLEARCESVRIDFSSHAFAVKLVRGFVLPIV